MLAIGIKALKDRLSEYLRLVAAGETVLVTDRDRVVAELGPPRPGRAETLDDAFLADAVRQGLLRPRLRPRGSVPPRHPIAPLEQILADLDEARGDR
jgi:antitoxin (DNA-binding transcriptional repressor) of toxin-antitoxin stability system